MNFSPRHHQVALTFLSGIGSRRARILVSHFNDLEEFFTDQQLNWAKIPGIPPDFVRYKQRLAALEEADRILKRCDQIGVETVFFTEADYPRRLKNCGDAPLLLYKKGNPDLNAPRIVSVVGTRHATDYGKEITSALIHALQSSGATVVSGMAYGIDICAHKAALTAGLATIGVLGHGPDLIYPSVHARIAAEMVQQGGLLTEFPPGLKPEPGFFPMRNRIVAGMADATIVIESGNKGGSLITANLANDYNRDVFAFPGDINRPYSAGCLKLISDNKAHLLMKPSDFVQMMNWSEAEPDKNTQTSLFTDLNSEEERVVTVLRTKKEMSQDIIGHLAELTVSQVSTLLLGLEFKGLVRSLPGKRFSLV